MLLRRFSAKGLCIGAGILRGFRQCGLQCLQMTRFRQITDYHHAQHAVAVDYGFRNPTLAVASDLVHNAIMGLASSGAERPGALSRKVTMGSGCGTVISKSELLTHAAKFAASLSWRSINSS